MPLIGSTALPPLASERMADDFQRQTFERKVIRALPQRAPIPPTKVATLLISPLSPPVAKPLARRPPSHPIFTLDRISRPTPTI